MKKWKFDENFQKICEVNSYNNNRSTNGATHNLQYQQHTVLLYQNTISIYPAKMVAVLITSTQRLKFLKDLCFRMYSFLKMDDFFKDRGLRIKDPGSSESKPIFGKVLIR